MYCSALKQGSHKKEFITRLDLKNFCFCEISVIELTGSILFREQKHVSGSDATFIASSTNFSNQCSVEPRSSSG